MKPTVAPAAAFISAHYATEPGTGTGPTVPRTPPPPPSPGVNTGQVGGTPGMDIDWASVRSPG